MKIFYIGVDGAYMRQADWYDPTKRDWYTFVHQCYIEGIGYKLFKKENSEELVVTTIAKTSYGWKIVSPKMSNALAPIIMGRAIVSKLTGVSNVR